MINAEAIVRSAIGTVRGSTPRNRLIPLFTLKSQSGHPASPGAPSDNWLQTTSPQTVMAGVFGELHRVSQETNVGRDFGIPNFQRFLPAIGIGYDLRQNGSYYLPSTPFNTESLATALIFGGEINPLTQTASLVPIYRLVSCTFDYKKYSYVTSRPDTGNPGACVENYFVDAIEGYIYPINTSPQPVGTEEVYIGTHSSGNKAIVLGSERNRTAFSGFTYGSAIGYAYPLVQYTAPTGSTRTLIDSDADGLPDGFERVAGSSPFLSDSDGDGFDDAFELPFAGLQPFNGDPVSTADYRYSFADDSSGVTLTIHSDNGPSPVTLVYLVVQSTDATAPVINGCALTGIPAPPNAISGYKYSCPISAIPLPNDTRQIRVNLSRPPGEVLTAIAAYLYGDAPLGDTNTANNVLVHTY